MIAQLHALKETRGCLISLLFRLYILFYTIFLLGHVRSMEPGTLIMYILIGSIYVFLTIYSINWGVMTSRWISIIADTLFVVVFFFFYGGKFDTFSLTLALLPIIGNICLSDLHFNKFLAISIPASVYGVILWCNTVDIWTFVSPFLIVSIIVMFGDIYSKLQKKILKISEIMDSFFISKENLLKSYKIYEGFINVLKEKPLPIDIEAIYCFFKSETDSLYLYNASKYVWSYSFDNHNIIQLSKLNGIEKYTDMHLTINGQLSETNRIYVVSLNDNISYMFVVELGEAAPLTSLLLKITFQTLFIKLAKLYESERLQRNIESHKMIALSEKANYVNAAVSTLHFMRNKLSPMKTLFSIVDEIEVEKDDNKRAIMKEFMKKDISKMRDSYKLMIDRANLLLDDSVTPFIYRSTKRFALKDLLSEIRQSWQDYRLDESNINIQLQKDSEGENCYVFYNQEGLGLVLDNWISNISKYSVNSYSLVFVETEQNVILTFANGYDSKTSLNFIRCYSNDNRAEINKNKWHGISNIKDFLEQMQIQGEISNDNENIYFKIIFSKTVDDEKSADN